jgi:hypothetical protein
METGRDGRCTIIAMRKRISLLLALLFAATMIQAQDFAGGNGTEASPYLITTPQQLSNLRMYLGTGYRDTYYRIAGDIDLSEFSTVTWGNSGWMPVGTPNEPFCGHLDGNNHTLSGLFTGNKYMNYVGLFGSISGIFSNIKITGCWIHGYNNCGGLTGLMKDGSQIENCSVEGFVTGNSYVGGLTGSGAGTINNCHVKVQVSGSSEYVGGIVGYGGALITNCSVRSTGTGIYGRSYTGGIIGCCDRLFITNCSVEVPTLGGNSYTGGLVGCCKEQLNMGRSQVTCSISGTGNYVGGLVGFSGSSTVIDSCQAHSGIITGSGNYVGGLVGGCKGLLLMHSRVIAGQVSGGVNGYYTGGLVGGSSQDAAIVTIQMCYAASNLTSGTTYVGGAIGYANSGIASVQMCYIVGNSISGSVHVGGIIGYANCDITSIVRCYTDSKASGRSNVGGLAGTIEGSVGTITDCYAVNVNNIIGSKYAGGIVGYHNNSSSGIITRSYSRSPIQPSLTNYTGAVIGYGSANISYCYFERQTWNQAGSGTGNERGITALTTEEMKSRSSFAGFDFEGIWDIYEGEGYPFLREMGAGFPAGSKRLPETQISMYAFAGNGQLFVGGLRAGERIVVYNLRGQVVYSGQATDGEQHISLPATGIYIVASGRQSVKVVYRK